MGVRRLSREFSLQFLYACDIKGSFTLKDIKEFWDIFIEVHHLDESIKEDTVFIEFVDRLLNHVLTHLEDIDKTIRIYTTNWDFNRITVVDRNILRMALAEIFYMADIPSVVSIDEAVDIAKKYSTPDSGKFVNGVLDKVKDECAKKE
ncbi:MAG: transcription antitermination factor NusB [Candidatus Auribacterota bacterium]